MVEATTFPKRIPCKHCGRGVLPFGDCEPCNFGWDQVAPNIWLAPDSRDFGDNLYIDPNAKLVDIPNKWRTNLRKKHEQVAFRQPQEYFGSLAANCPVAGLKRWLEYLAACSFDFMTYKIFEDEGRSPAFYCRFPQKTCVLHLAEGYRGPKAHPDVLKNVFRRIGWINNYSENFVLDPFDGLGDDWPFPRKGLLLLLEGQDDNDLLVADQTEAYWLQSRVSAGKLEDVVDAYFDEYFENEVQEFRKVAGVF